MQNTALVTKSNILQLKGGSRFEGCRTTAATGATALEAKRRQPGRASKLHILM
jgi:hypothetical protein